MNIFGLLASIVGCVSAILIVWLVVKHPISIRIIRTTEPPKLVSIAKPALADETVKKINQETATYQYKPETDKDVEITSMDAVIKSVNEMMGVETVSKEMHNDRKE